MDTQFITNHLTMQNLLNCYIKETGRGEWKSDIQSELPIEQGGYESILVIPFNSQSVTLYVPVYYKSETGRHIVSSGKRRCSEENGFFNTHKLSAKGFE